MPCPAKVRITFNEVALDLFVPDDVAFPDALIELFIREDYKVEFLEAPGIILDVGGNFGLASLYFAVMYPGVEIHAFEPSSECFQYLRQNTQAYPNIHLHNSAIFSHGGTGRLYLNDRSGGNNSLLDENGTFEEITLTTLDEFMASHDIVHVDLMKIDVEGAEEEILTSSRCLERIDFIVGELHLKLIDRSRTLAALDPTFSVVSEPIESDFELIRARNRRTMTQGQPLVGTEALPPAPVR